jgi:hypothetical protein
MIDLLRHNRRHRLAQHLPNGLEIGDDVVESREICRHAHREFSCCELERALCFIR